MLLIYDFIPWYIYCNMRFVRLEFEEQNVSRGLTASGNIFIDIVDVRAPRHFASLDVIADCTHFKCRFRKNVSESVCVYYAD